MRKLNLLSATALQSAAVLGALFVATPAAAQDAPAADDSAQADVTTQEQAEGVDCDVTPDAPDCQAIVVTGSRIARSVNLKSVVPITSISPDDLTSRGEVSLGDSLNDLPALRSTFSQANSTGSIGTAGLSLLDLRGLGTQRTLVLVNGRRHVTAQPGNYNVDVNTIPVDLIDRIDVVTGGNSAVYGSDAVAGVVNFVLDRDFEGIKVRGQSGISTYGDRGNQFLSAVAGRNFMDGRLNVTLHGEYSNSDEVFFSDRRYLGAYSGPSGFITSQITTAPNRNFDGIPNTSFYDNEGGDLPGIRFGNISGGGYVLTSCPAPTATNAARVAAACSGQLSPTGGRIARNYAFQRDGTLLPDVPFIDNRSIGGGVIGGLSSTGTEDAMLLPGLKRYVGNIFVNAEISPAFEPFLEGKFVRVEATQQSVQPTFIASSLNPIFRTDNPFLSAQARATLATVTGNAATFQMQRFNNDLGTRAEDHERNTYRIVGGVRGSLSDTGNLRYEAAVNYGKTKTYYETGGNVLVANFNRATDAVRDPVGGQIVCRINSSLDRIPAGQPNAGAINTANDDPACAPLNVFGEGNASQAAKDYVLYTSSRDQKASQLNGVAFISGDSEGLFRLPGGPVGFALGAEYRRETASSVYDEVTQQGLTFLNAFQPFLPPKEVVKEGFGELRLPLLADIEGINELTVEGSARFSKYRGAKGVWAYNAGVIYSPTDGMRLRSGFARSVRAPNLGDRFASRTETFANGLTDPCDQPGPGNASNNITSNPNRAANCAAAGIPTTITYTDNSGNVITQPWHNIPGSGVSGVNQGNENLVPERSNSFTVGAVFEPDILPGFSLTVDYYHIKVKDVISGLTGQAIINRCYDDPTGINNEFCAAVFRRTSANPIENGTFNGQTNRRLVNRNQDNFARAGDGIAFLNQPFNFSALVRQGIDFDASYRRKILGDSNLTLRGIVSYLMKSENFSYLTQPDRSDRIHETFGDPIFAASWNAGLDIGKVDFAYGGTFVGKQTILAYETQFTHQGRGPTNPDARPFPYYPSQVIHNARINFEPTDKYRMYVGVDNVTNERPPLDLTGIEAGSPYGPTGRYFYAGAEIRFK